MSTEQDNTEKLEQYKKQPPHPSYIAGFIDGDGCVFIRKIRDGYQSGISFTQCRTNILQILRYHFGGTITSSGTNRNNKVVNIIDEITGKIHKHNIRNQYNLLIRSNEYTVMLEYIQNSFVIKHNQINCLNKMKTLINQQNKKEEKDELFTICCQYNKKIKVSQPIFQHINMEYIAGLFDAEGCFYISSKNLSKMYISITQKNHPEVLAYISKLLGFGTIDCEDKLKIYKKADCLKFIHLVKPHLIVKYNQATAFETCLTTNDKTIKEETYVICNREKHEIEVFDKLNQNNEGKDGFNEALKVREMKEKLCKELLVKEVYKEKSNKMMAEGNHNYGKSFSEETKKKMSSSIRDAKQGVSDETIIKVRELIEQGHKNSEIQELLDLPRHTITRIKNGLLVCRTEEKTSKVSLSQEDLNISKRKINVEEIIQVIEKCIAGCSPKEILDYLTKQRYMYNIENTLTIDIIKNIKRTLAGDKPIIYQKELSETRYQYYCFMKTQYMETLSGKKTS